MDKKWIHLDLKLSENSITQREIYDFKFDERIKINHENYFETWIPCAYFDMMLESDALAKFFDYVRDFNNIDKDISSYLDYIVDEHVFTEASQDDHILFITPNGCTVGKPKEEEE